MFNYAHIQAIFIRIFITFVTNNLARVNGTIDRRALKEQTIYEAFGLKVWIRERADGFYLGIALSGPEGEVLFKLGKTASIGKAVLNKINVWAHKAVTPLHSEAIQMLHQAISKVNIHDHISKISILNRFLFASNEVKLDLGSSLMNEVIQGRMIIRRSIFNKLVIFVEVQTQGPSGPVAMLFPVFNGVMRDYRANLNSDPVNTWTREILLEHVETHLK